MLGLYLCTSHLLQNYSEPTLLLGICFQGQLTIIGQYQLGIAQSDVLIVKANRNFGQCKYQGVWQVEDCCAGSPICIPILHTSLAFLLIVADRCIIIYCCLPSFTGFQLHRMIYSLADSNLIQESSRVGPEQKGSWALRISDSLGRIPICKSNNRSSQFLGCQVYIQESQFLACLGFSGRPYP